MVTPRSIIFNSLKEVTTSCVAIFSDTYSASIVDKVTISCFLLDQLIVLPDMMKRFTVVEC